MKVDIQARKNRHLICRLKIRLSQMKEVEKVWQNSDSKKIRPLVT
jgi:hypothetical protein